MNMNSLYEDFKNYIEMMDDADVMNSICRAMEHTVNSEDLDMDIDISDFNQTATQEIKISYTSSNHFAFTSPRINCNLTSHPLSNMGGIAA